MKDGKRWIITIINAASKDTRDNYRTHPDERTTLKMLKMAKRINEKLSKSVAQVDPMAWVKNTSQQNNLT